ncbi:hypothetical protein [Burkholderia singularis]|uniref:hypothetical protein n=1 Tax=Burkholderia singularis TaxID=1503053 RepID=UPI00117FAA0A|nr:hypothetical protein [Burkholderia singularis]
MSIHTGVRDIPGFKYQIQVNNSQNYVIASKNNQIVVTSINDSQATLYWYFLPLPSTGQFYIFLQDGDFNYDSTDGIVSSGNFINYNPQTPDAPVTLETYPGTTAFTWVTETPLTGNAYNWGSAQGKSTTACITTTNGGLLLPTAYKNDHNSNNPAGSVSVDHSKFIATTQDFTQWLLSGSTN